MTEKVPLMGDCPKMHEFAVLQGLRKSPEILELLQDKGESELRVQKRLRRQFPDEIVRAALSLAELRRKAAAKFSRASEMWFDRVGLEQATSEAVARHKARRFAGEVLDCCAGMGGDSIALAERCRVVAVDVNPANCLRVKWNAEVYGVAENLQPLCADVETMTARSRLLHIDPDRRAGSKGKTVRLEDCVPGLEQLQQMTRSFSGGAIKLSPAGNFGGKFPGAETELISLDGECKEATIWFGALAGDVEWRATVLPSGATLAGDPLESLAEIGPLRSYLYDPDPAVVRAGLIDMLAEQASLQRLDDAEEYLTSDRLVHSPFVRAFEVLAELPNNDREFRSYFRKSDFGQVEIKCRHIPISADAVRKKLPLPGDRPGVLIFARIAGKARAVVCRRLPLVNSPGAK